MKQTEKLNKTKEFKDLERQYNEQVDVCNLAEEQYFDFKKNVEFIKRANKDLICNFDVSDEIEKTIQEYEKLLATQLKIYKTVYNDAFNKLGDINGQLLDLLRG